jgi:hypothetical protein
VAKLKSRHGSRVPPSTLAAWNAEHRELATYARLREEGRRLTPPSQTIRTVKLYHRQVYEYAYHRPKIALLTQSKEHLRYTAGLAPFLEAVPKACPHNLFTPPRCLVWVATASRGADLVFLGSAESRFSAPA